MRRNWRNDSEPEKFGLFNVQERLEAIDASHLSDPEKEHVRFSSRCGNETDWCSDSLSSESLHANLSSEDMHSKLKSSATLQNSAVHMPGNQAGNVDSSILADDHSMVREGLRKIMDFAEWSRGRSG